MAGKLWTREELILAFNLYLQIPFGKVSYRNPEIIRLAKLINRTADAVSMRLSNFASVDPFHQARGISGLKGGIKQVQPIWDEFNDNREELLFESERLLADLEGKNLDEKYPDLKLLSLDMQGETRIREIKTRVNQNVFRKMVLVNYNSQCAISGIDIPEMLIASHIIPWSVNEKERLNPSNGICLSAHFDRAFDKGLITFDSDYRLVLSPQLKDYATKDYFKTWFKRFEGKPLNIPQNYSPSLKSLQWHYSHVYSAFTKLYHNHL